MTREGVKADLGLGKTHFIKRFGLKVHQGRVHLGFIIFFSNKKENLGCTLVAAVIFFITIKTQAFFTVIG